jgi:hypothetical protein
MTAWHCPNDTDLSVDPDLAPLVLLDAALAVTINALHAFVPELQPTARTWSDSSPPVLLARQIVVHSTFLRDLIDDYRHKLANREASFGPLCDDHCF